MTFDLFALDPAILDALKSMGYNTPTAVQQQAIPLILEGHDLIALAETGSGKTAACAIPVSHKIDASRSTVQGLIIVPTRELAMQYAMETQRIGKKKGIKAFALFGGEEYSLQEAKLKAGVHVLIATPGRLIDFIYTRKIDLSHVETLIIDEGDKLLSMGFYDDLEFIIQCLIHDHQTLLFSATLPPEIRKLASLHMKSPKEVTLISSQPTPTNIEHLFYMCPPSKKRGEAIRDILQREPPAQVIIFCSSRQEVEDLCSYLKRHFQEIDFLHGGLTQQLRTKITDKFRRNKTKILVATDVAARGLDFSGISHVINTYFPKDRDTYLHRAGRTGRIGRSGKCITLIGKRDLSRVQALLDLISKPLQWY